MKSCANIIISRLFRTHDECPTHFLTSRLYPDPSMPRAIPSYRQNVVATLPWVLVTEFYLSRFIYIILKKILFFILEREEGREKERERSIDVWKKHRLASNQQPFTLWKDVQPLRANCLQCWHGPQVRVPLPLQRWNLTDVKATKDVGNLSDSDCKSGVFNNCI